MSNRKKLISLAPRKPRPASADLPMPTLKEFWEALQQAKNGGAELPASARAGSGCVLSSGRLYGSGSGRLYGSGSGRLYGSGSGSRYGSGSGSGEDTAGYGVDLVAPTDHFSAERIMTIMRDLCAKEAKQKK